MKQIQNKLWYVIQTTVAVSISLVLGSARVEDTLGHILVLVFSDGTTLLCFLMTC